MELLPHPRRRRRVPPSQHNPRLLLISIMSLFQFSFMYDRPLHSCSNDTHASSQPQADSLEMQALIEQHVVSVLKTILPASPSLSPLLEHLLLLKRLHARRNPESSAQTAPVQIRAPIALALTICCLANSMIGNGQSTLSPNLIM